MHREVKEGEGGRNGNGYVEKGLRLDKIEGGAIRKTPINKNNHCNWNQSLLSFLIDRLM